MQLNAAWPVARQLAYDLGHELSPQQIPIDHALGLALASPVTALSDLPAFDTVSMDGWAVSDGAGPWDISGPMILAGGSAEPFESGTARPIATGATLPPGAFAVLRREDGELHEHRLTRRREIEPLAAGKDVRRQAEEARLGSVVLPAHIVLTPPMLGLAAAAGHDTLTVRRAPIIDVFIMGDELLSEGPSGGGRLRDSLRPQVVGWLTSVGAESGRVALLPDDVDATVAAIAASEADLVITTGGTARGPVDQLHPALEQLSAELILDQVAVRPGHPMALAILPGGRPLAGLPGNPLAAAVGFVTLAWSVVARLRGLPLPETSAAKVLNSISAPPDAHRLLPSAFVLDGVRPLMHHGPAMLSGLAAADCLAISPPGGISAGDAVDVLRLPWAR